MADSFQTFVGDGVTTQFNFTKPYLIRAHVELFVDGIEDTGFTFINDTLVETTPAPIVDAVVRVARNTPTLPFVDFEDGSTVTEADQDNALLQSLYVAQEAADSLGTTIQIALDDKIDAQNKIIKDVVDGNDPGDAVTKAQLDAAVIAAGNVPTPADPADDGKVLAASTGAFSWTSFLISMISDAAAFMKTFLGSADASTARTNLGLGALATKATVATADIDANSVDGTKIAMGSDAKGDIMAHDGTDFIKRTVGADDTILTADSAQADGVKWAPPASSVIERQVFTSGGTWTKPSVGTLAYVQVWGSGGSGAGQSGANGAGGGGGGGYTDGWFLLSDLGATETVTIGVGGVGVAASTNGNVGNSSTFGAFLEAFGGGAGDRVGTVASTGGGGGGAWGDGATPAAGAPGSPIAGTGGDAANSRVGQPATSGGGGGGGTQSGIIGVGGNSVYGGGGGGASKSGFSVGGTSAFGGDGSDGAASSANGAQPGGGSGGSTVTSGNGGDGQVVVAVF